MPSDPDCPLVRIAELEIDPSRLARYRALLAEEIAASVRLEPGVLSLQATALKHAPNQIRILEVYASRAAYEAHLTTPHFLAYKHATADMVRSLRLIDTEPVAIFSKPLPQSPARTPSSYS
ncbi:MAG: antibiotic biosynthesis monooxygenase [Devosia sp.]|nr:antibiotic biosynthesis monooxygenase [Devosia sp.]